jgi:hypothetical protein
MPENSEGLPAKFHRGARAPVNHIEAAQVAPRLITGKKLRKYGSFKRNATYSFKHLHHCQFCIFIFMHAGINASYFFETTHHEKYHRLRFNCQVGNQPCNI